MKDSVAIARDCYQAYVRKDRAALEELIAEPFHFTSPLDNRIDRKTYFERCWPNSQHIVKFEFISVLPHGDKVFVTYEGTHTNGKGFRNTEILTVRQQKIVEVEVYFGWPVPHEAPAGGFINA
ncbi:MAG: nuclear transport factor 2 family protein [Pseudomonadota bacterium]